MVSSSTTKVLSDDKSRTILKHNHTSGVQLIARVESVCPGKWHGRDASLVFFVFSFQSPKSNLRFKNGSVKIQFKGADPREFSSEPTIMEIAPHVLRFEGEKSPSLEISGTTSDATSRALAPGTEGSGLVRGTTMMTSRERTDYDAVFWDVQEDPTTKGGIPQIMKTGVILGTRTSSLVQATVEVKLEACLSYRTRKLSTDVGWKKTPIQFAPGVPFGDQPPYLNPQDLTLRNWHNGPEVRACPNCPFLSEK
jgi:hypothetical protein